MKIDCLSDDCQQRAPSNDSYYDSHRPTADGPIHMSTNGIEHQKPVPEEWRTLLQNIVDAFVDGDFGLTRGVVGVLPVSSDLAVRNAKYVSIYGETLTNLPEETWPTSFCVRYEPHWDILIDLWTQGEGSSDMVLAVQATPVEGAEMPVFRVGIIYVP